MGGVCDTGLIRGGEPAQGCDKDSGEKDNELTVAAFWKQAMMNHPGVKFAHVQSKADNVQHLFYKAIAFDYGMMGEMSLRPPGFFRKTNLLFIEYNAYPNWVSFMVGGSQHTFFFFQDEEFEGTNIDGLPMCNFYRADTTGKSGMGANNAPLMYKWVGLFDDSLPSSECDGTR